ncbi:MAG: hypothetical protein P8Y84_12820 [Desulfuromonadales bacterium]
MRVLQITDVLAEKSTVATRQADGVLQLRADRQNRRGGDRQGHRARHITAGSPEQQRLPGHHPGDRIIGPHVNPPIMAEKGIGHGRQALAGFFVLIGNRFIGKIGTGHDQGTKRLREEQMMKRRIGQHDAEISVIGGKTRRQAMSGPFLHQHDRSFHTGQKPRLEVVDKGQFARRRQVFDHQGERFFIALFTAAQRRDGGFVGGIGSQVITAQSLDGNDLPRSQSAAGFRQRITPPGVALPGDKQAQLRAAVRTGIRLGVETS